MFANNNNNNNNNYVNDLTNLSNSTNTTLGGTTYNGTLNFNSNARNIYDAVYKLSDEYEQCSSTIHTPNLPSTIVNKNATTYTVLVRNVSEIKLKFFLRI